MVCYWRCQVRLYMCIRSTFGDLRQTSARYVCCAFYVNISVPLIKMIRFFDIEPLVGVSLFVRVIVSLEGASNGVHATDTLV